MVLRLVPPFCFTIGAGIYGSCDMKAKYICGYLMESLLIIMLSRCASCDVLQSIVATPLLLGLVLVVPPRFLSYPAHSISTSLAPGGERTTVCICTSMFISILCSLSISRLQLPITVRFQVFYCAAPFLAPPPSPCIRHHHFPQPLPPRPLHPSQTPSLPHPSSAYPSPNSSSGIQTKKNAAGARAATLVSSTWICARRRAARRFWKMRGGCLA